MDYHQCQDQESSTSEGIHNFQFPTTAAGYRILSQIGVSDHSVVYMANVNVESATVVVAVKVIDINIDIDPVSVTNLNSLSLVNHANVLSPHCCFTADDGRLWIVMPFIHAGPLQAILSNRFPTGLPDQFLAILFHQLLRGLVCLHEMGFVHKAIKASNVFFDSQGSVKLSDLSVSSSTKDENDDDDEYDESSSVPYWVPVDEEYSFKSDVWSIGILAMEIAYGGPPISDTRIIRSQISSISRRFPYDLNLGKTSGDSSSSITNRKFGDSFKDFVSSCLVKDQFRRPSASSLLAHPFVKKGESSNFLFKSIAKGMVGIGDKFQRDKERLVGLMKKKKNNSNYSSSKKNVKVDKILKISGWDYNNFLFELEPDEESLGKRVRFRGETIIQFREDQESKIDHHMPLAASLVERIDDKFEVMDSENFAKALSSLLESVDQQRNVVMMLITQFGYFNQRELEMTKEISRLEAELTSEKEKSFQLELDYEVLKLKLPDSEDEEDQEDNS